MLFNTIPFFIFFTIVYFTYWNIGRKFKYDFLIFAGAAFYFYYSPIFLLHFLLVICINYFFYYKIYTGNKNLFVKLAVIFNLLNLGFFKYFYLIVLGRALSKPSFLSSSPSRSPRRNSALGIKLTYSFLIFLIFLSFFLYNIYFFFPLY